MKPRLASLTRKEMYIFIITNRLVKTLSKTKWRCLQRHFYLRTLHNNKSQNRTGLIRPLKFGGRVTTQTILQFKNNTLTIWQRHHKE